MTPLSELLNAAVPRGRTAALGLLAFAAIIAARPFPAAAQSVQRIAAIVNDQVISAYDLNQRIRLVLVTSGIPETPENVGRIREQVLRSLIDESLKLQEAAKNKVTINKQEIEEEIARLAKQNNMSGDQVVKMLTDRGVSEDTLRDQIKAEVAWSKMVRGRFMPRVNVSAEEIDQVIERMKLNQDKPQYRVSEIFLPVDSPDQAPAVEQTAMRLLQQIRQGAPFPQIARNFSQAASASNGGDIGWVQDGQLPPALNDVVSKLKPGRISLPIRTVGGYYILAMSDRRLSSLGEPSDAELDLYEVIIPMQAKLPKEKQMETLALATGISQKISGCDQARQLVQQYPQFTGNNLGRAKLSTMPDNAVKKQLSILTTGNATDPLRNQTGFSIFFICNRTNLGTREISREAVENQLFGQQLSMMARRYLRDLRRDATVEMR